ncbi:MAG: TRAP transporter small permease [Pseudomonadota bacterium]
MSTVKAFRAFEKAVTLASKTVNAIGAIFLLAMMGMIFAEVFMRYLFNAPIEGSFEMVEYMMALVISLSIAYTGSKKGHIAVELLVSKFPERMQALLDVFHFLVCTIFFWLLCWKTASQAMVWGKAGVTSQVLLIPVSPFTWVLAVCAALLGLVFLMQSIDALIKVVDNG